MRLILILTAGVLGLAALIERRAMLRGTTLAAASIWACAALFLVCAAEIVTLPPHWQDMAGHTRYLAAVSTFCPVMALMGAKRPQHAAWQWIVLGLWTVLALPGIERILIRPGDPSVLDWPRSVVVLVLLGVELFAYMATRFWLSALLVVAAQAGLMWEHFPFASAPEVDLQVPAVILAMLGVVCMPRFKSAPGSAGSWQKVWLDFRDLFGALWALRVAERFNAIALQEKGNLRLGWQGFMLASEQRPTDQRSAAPAELAEGSVLIQSFQMLLLRFLSPQWIQQRLTAPVAEAQGRPPS